MAERRADRFDLGEALLEIGLVITSVTLLTRSRIYWYFGIVFAVAGDRFGGCGVLDPLTIAGLCTDESIGEWKATPCIQ